MTINNERHIDNEAHRLADLLCAIAVDLCTCGKDEWRDAGDMLQATINNIAHDFTCTGAVDGDRLTMHARNLGIDVLAKFEMQRLCLEDGDTVAIYGDWGASGMELLDAISAGMRDAHPGKRITVLAFDKHLTMQKLETYEHE